MRKCPLYELVN